MAGTAFIAHFGCRLNQYEADGMKAGFLNEGFKITQNVEESDYIVLNTCTVTNRADAKNRSSIRRYHDLNPRAKIIVTGCYATTDADVISSMPGVYSVVDNARKAIIPALVKNKSTRADGRFGYPYRKRTGNARAYLKIQDGCNKSCSYCKIPHARGGGVSRNVEETIQEATNLVSQGFQEIVLTGVNIGWYKNDDVDFYSLLEKLLNIEGEYYIRLSSIEPGDVTEQLAELFTHPRMGRFLHVPLQSGSKEILKKMRRGYTPGHFKSWVELVKEKVPDIHLGTDIIVGFPSENEPLFRETLEFKASKAFSNIHIFPFSKRNDTQAVKLIQEGTLTEINGKVIKERCAQLAALKETMASHYIRKTANNAYRAIYQAGEAPRLVTENYVILEAGHIPGLAHGQMTTVRYDERKNVVL